MSDNKYVGLMKDEMRWHRTRESCYRQVNREVADGCGKMATDWQAAAEAFEAALAVLGGYKAWEAQLLLCDEAWRDVATPHLSQELFDGLIELQTQRNKALKKAGVE